MHLKTILIKPASSQCNMSCDYCFYCDEAAKREYSSYGMMTEETLRHVIKKSLFQADSDICFAFQGGEPTLCGVSFFEKVVEFEQRYNRNGVKIFNTLQTNGFQIDHNWCKFFKENQFLVGVSVDGTQETHDQFRHTKSGLPTYERIYHSTKMLEEYQIEYNILTVVNAFTASHIQEIYNSYKKNGWRYQQYIACLDPIDQNAGTQPYSLTPELYGEFLINLFDMWYKDWKRGSSPYIRDFENYIGILMGYYPEACTQRGVCTIQGVVEADGSVYPCDFFALDEYKLGNFNENKVTDFFENEKARSFVEESKKISVTCKNCEYYLLCHGGCRRTRAKENKTDTYRSYFCKSYRMFFEKTFTRMKEIANYLT